MNYGKTANGEATRYGRHLIEIRQTRTGPLKGRFRIYVDGKLLQDYLCVSAESAKQRVQRQVIPQIGKLAPRQEKPLRVRKKFSGKNSAR